MRHGRDIIGNGMTECKTELGKFFRANRLRLNLSQEEAGRRLGMTQTGYAAYEVGYRKHLKPYYFEKVQKVFGCRLAEIPGWKEYKEKLKMSRVDPTVVLTEQSRKDLEYLQKAMRTNRTNVIVRQALEFYRSHVESNLHRQAS